MEECYFWSITLLKATLLHGCFSRFLNCTYDTKSRKGPHIQSFYVAVPDKMKAMWREQTM